MKTLLNFVETYLNYMPERRNFVNHHAEHAISKISNNNSSFLVAAAINHYIYSYCRNKNWAGGSSAFEVLSTGYANCGGKTVAMAEMLHSRGIKCRLAYAIGKEPAHSMVEVMFDDGKCGLFDPFIGAVYLNKESKDPISIFAIKELMQADQVSVLFARSTRQDDGSVQPMASFDETYSFHPKDKEYLIYPKRIKKYRTLGIQNSGCLDAIDIVLKPGQLIGHSRFQPKPDDPEPWIKLGMHIYCSHLGEEEHLSWAYMLGHTGQGYRIQHIYYLKNLSLGKSYTLKLHIVTGYRSPFEHWPEGNSPKITLKQVIPCGESFHYSVLNRTVKYDDFIPQVVSVTFQGICEEMCFLGHGAGNILLCGIALEEEG